MLTCSVFQSVQNTLGSPVTTPTTDAPTHRARHPSESSCTAEANNISFCDPNCSCDRQSCSHGYYNYGCSNSSTIAVSPSQSRTSGASMPLSANALLHQQLKAKESVSDGELGANLAAHEVAGINRSGSSESPPRTPHHQNRSVNFSQSSGNRRMGGRSRRASTPEDGTILSNATVETRVSCGTLTSDI